MRIEISAREVTPLQTELSSLCTDINSTIEALRKTRKQFYDMSGGVSNLSDAVESLDQRIRHEERKLDAAQALGRKATAFFNNAITTDAQVARMVSANREQFFRQYEWLRPVVPEEKSWWEQKLDGWNQFWESAGEAFQNLMGKVGGFISGAVDCVKETVKEIYSTVVTFVKEHWVELLVGTVAIVVGAVLIAVSGGTAAAFLPALAAGFKAAAISALIDGAISAGVAWLMGGDVGEAFGDGLASGFMIGGIVYAAGAVKTLRTSMKLKKMVASGEITQVDLNRLQGKQFELAKGETFKAKYPNSDTQITIETMVDGKPVKFKIDWMADDNGNLILQELKSSPSASLTPNQKATWGKELFDNGRYGILENGGIVKGRINKALFPGGFQIPPGTVVEIIRPPAPFSTIEAMKNIQNFTIYSGGITGIVQNIKNIFSGSATAEEGAYVSE